MVLQQEIVWVRFAFCIFGNIKITNLYMRRSKQEASKVTTCEKREKGGRQSQKQIFLSGL